MSKFEPLESYLSAKGQYKLLPLRFESISDDEVVLTNAVGEFTLKHWNVSVKRSSFTLRQWNVGVKH
ncbi:hypothetical protein [Ralstonia mannitolilytica]|uniref:hypothetical protein n=1 Tax=Ralstonia mannitolilytica TaxID=105219 RepID=UPI0028F5F501|nr:hypothetical protein [Ralstonia mannitolilytica]CAJ0880106.1 hypothetical protein R76727_03257 [Ralstonia mannitolilytica]